MLEEGRQEITRGDTHNQAVRPWVALYYDSSLEVPGQRTLIESHGPRFIELAEVWEEVEAWKDSVSDYAQRNGDTHNVKIDIMDLLVESYETTGLG